MRIIHFWKVIYNSVNSNIKKKWKIKYYMIVNEVLSKFKMFMLVYFLSAEFRKVFYIYNIAI